MENIASQFMAEGLESIGSVAKGLKNITIEIENNCPRCFGEGKRPNPFARMPIDKSFNPDLEFADINPEMIDCTKCNGSGLQNVTVKIDVTKTPGIKKEDKKK